MTTPPVGVAEVRTVCCVGAGVIGGGWAAYFLAHGYDVLAWDPAPGAAERLEHLVDAAWPALTELGLAEGADRSRLRVEPLLERALAQAEFVQESAPEDLDLKVKLLAEIDAAAPEGIVISSSTSGYGMSEMQVACATPGGRSSGIPSTRPTSSRSSRSSAESRRRPRSWPGPPTSSATLASQ